MTSIHQVLNNPASISVGLTGPAAPAPKWLLDIDQIYMEPAVEEFSRGREILARFPHAERIEVGSYWKIPGLFGFEGNVTDWNRIKRRIPARV